MCPQRVASPLTSMLWPAEKVHILKGVCAFKTQNRAPESIILTDWSKYFCENKFEDVFWKSTLFRWETLNVCIWYIVLYHLLLYPSKCGIWIKINGITSETWKHPSINREDLLISYKSIINICSSRTHTDTCNQKIFSLYWWCITVLLD